MISFKQTICSQKLRNFDTKTTCQIVDHVSIYELFPKSISSDQKSLTVKFLDFLQDLDLHKVGRNIYKTLPTGSNFLFLYSTKIELRIFLLINFGLQMFGECLPQIAVGGYRTWFRVLFLFLATSEVKNVNNHDRDVFRLD